MLSGSKYSVCIKVVTLLVTCGDTTNTLTDTVIFEVMPCLSTHKNPINRLCLHQFLGTKTTDANEAY